MSHNAVFLSVHNAAETPEVIFRNIAIPIIQHPLGWVRYGYTFTVVADEADADIRVMLTPQSEMDKRFPSFAKSRMSVCDMDSKEVFINEDRWTRKFADKSQLSLPAYRTYVLQHEVGHALGKYHEKCKGRGERTPVMLQQTLGPGKCTPYPFPSSISGIKKVFGT
jgi:hypothetical protein